MADNTTLNAGTGGDVIGSDDIAAVKYQRVKLIHGADGVNDGDVSRANPHPSAAPINVATQIDTTTTPLAISAVYTGPTFDSTVTGKFATHFIYADVDGQHSYEESHDGTTWHVVDLDTVVGGTTFVEEHIVNARYHRSRYLNGATGQTTFHHQHVCSFVGVAHNVGIRSGDNVVKGDKTNNGQSASTEAFESFAAYAKASAPTHTDGNTVLLRTLLNGDLVVTLEGETVQLAASTNNIGDVDVLTLPALPAGTNNIGDVDVLTLPAIPAGTNNIGDVDVASVTGAGTIATGQVSVATTSTLIVAQRTGRRAVIVIQHGTTAVYVGVTGLTTSNGALLTGTTGAAMQIPTSAAVYGIVGAGTQTVSYMEVY